MPPEKEHPTAACIAAEWNVLTTPWLDVTDLDGHLVITSPLRALRESGRLHRIVASSPLDVFAAHRFLLTLLYWKADAGGGVEKVRAALLAGSVPEAVLDAIEAEAGCFNLFDPKRPFLQDITLANVKTGSSPAFLFTEMTRGTNVAHFHHGDDECLSICPACFTAGLLRLVPFWQSPGQPYSAAIHGPPPVVALAMGESLVPTLGMNIVPLSGEVGSAKWTGQFKPSDGAKAVPYLEALTWNPLRVLGRLPDRVGPCWRCGDANAHLLGSVVIAANAETVQLKDPVTKKKQGVFKWRDPAAFYAEKKPFVTAKSNNEEMAAVQSDVASLFGRTKSDTQYRSLVQQANPTHRHWFVVIPCTDNKAKPYDHRSASVEGFDGIAHAQSVACLVGDQRAPNPLDAIDTKPTSGSLAFVRAATTLDSGAWGVLTSAAHRSMEEGTEAFDIFTGLHWPLRNRYKSLPSRQAAWMVLKLMASAGKYRPMSGAAYRARFEPWTELPTKQLPSKRRKGQAATYPRGLPTGDTLEAELRQIIRRFIARKPAAGIDWPGLCQFLNEVIE